jgi:simple sugar transport system ATP-binding protein
VTISSSSQGGASLQTIGEDATSAPPVADGLSLRGITKRFGTLTANDHIDLDIVPGRIHCLLGENGAGKSTLMNILYGLLEADEGTISIDGVEQHFDNPKQAMAAGIGMVHQHFMLVEVFTVAENIILGREPSRAGALDMGRARAGVRELSDRYHLEVNPDALVENLPVGVQQRVEILKSLANDAKFLIFDEPTAVLTPQEIDELMAVMRALRDEGRAIVFITHKLHEVRAIADDITVIRRGTVVGTARPSDSEGRLAEMMVGRAVNLVVDKEPADPGDTRLEIDHLTVADDTGAVMVDDVSLRVAGGEILCIAGVQGNGQTELSEALLGTVRPSSGRILIDGVETGSMSPGQTIRTGLGFVPRTASGTASSGSTRWPRTSSSTTSRTTPGPAACGSARSAGTPSTGSRSSTSGPPRSTCRCDPCRAAISRRWCWPANCPASSACWSPRSPPAASTSAPSSSCTSGWSPSATGAPRCSSSPPSWTRSRRWPTGSR